jgi:hypothetical protein
MGDVRCGWSSFIKPVTHRRNFICSLLEQWRIFHFTYTLTLCLMWFWQHAAASPLPPPQTVLSGWSLCWGLITFSANLDLNFYILFTWNKYFRGLRSDVSVHCAAHTGTYIHTVVIHFVDGPAADECHLFSDKILIGKGFNHISSPVHHWTIGRLCFAGRSRQQMDWKADWTWRTIWMLIAEQNNCTLCVCVSLSLPPLLCLSVCLSYTHLYHSHIHRISALHVVMNTVNPYLKEDQKVCSMCHTSLYSSHIHLILLQEAIALLDPMTNDPVNFVRQGALIASAMILIQQTEHTCPKVRYGTAVRAGSWAVMDWTYVQEISDLNVTCLCDPEIPE